MVDCGNPRCAQERRSFRKELLSWGKKVPVLLAYEAIAGRFGGQKVSNEIQAKFNGLESDTPNDFTPEKECVYCKSKLASIVDIVGKLSDDAKKGKIDPDNSHLRYLHDLLPFCAQYYTHIGKKETDKQGEDSDSSLSAKSRTELKVPQLPSQRGKSKKDLASNGKRAYSDDDLVSAVGDIRSGKLGTRRASTIYGIPRSTLRNKIFKMEIEDRQHNINEDSSSIDETVENNMKLKDLMQAGSFQFLPPLPFLLPYQKQAELSPEDFEKKMEYIRRKHNIDGSCDANARPAHVNELKLPLLADLIHKLVEQRFQLECQRSASSKSQSSSESKSSLAASHPIPYYSPLTAAYMSSFMTPEDPDIRIPSYKSATPSPINNHHNMTDKGKAYSKAYEEGRIGETLKDIIMKTITEKMRFKDSSDSSSETDLSNSLRSHLSTKTSLQMTIPNSKYSINNNHSPPKRSRKDIEKEKIATPNANALKKTRPKRGQYRKYNSALLMEAVRSVQRGEMSVHRAGSYYGVPHSTLEYKVKERHLLRQKKIREAQPAKESKAASSTSSAETASTSKTPKKSETAKSALSFTPSKDSSPSSSTSSSGLPWYQPYINANPDFKPDLSFFPSSFALSTPASELLRKLQHKVQNKTSPLIPDSTCDLPSTSHNGKNITNGDTFMLYNGH